MLIVLYGTSSAGKTTLAKAIQQLWPRPLLHIEADRFVPTIAEERLNECGDDFRAHFALTIHKAIATFGRSGIDTIVDGSMPGETGLRDRCISILRDAAPTRLVAVRCSVDVLRTREASRPDRVQGWAEEQDRTLYDGVEFDFTIDTSSKPAAECARDVLGALLPS